MKPPHRPSMSYSSETLSNTVERSGVKVTCSASGKLFGSRADTVLTRQALVNEIMPFTSKVKKSDPLFLIV